ncbi:MAG: dynamin family protein [Legionella sp.]|uniref:dynamin family protein n=1 Tax=Legionella sp. TaxID=459 RepID=UPI0028508885|nr:dynamin family protein [Legionella sp.]
MIGKQYKAHKDNVLDLFDNYKTKRDDFDDGIDIQFLESRIVSLRNGKFTLAVAGEVKSGKSTFINALLGAEILPSDVLQASSAIVEIFKSEKYFLNVKYANGREEIICDDLEATGQDKAKERLHEICKINDDYRQIPTTLIDDDIIAIDSEITVNDNFVKQLEQKSGENLQDKHSVIKKYITERTKDKIPVAIEFGYPLKWEFDELRIVDSPGVNATGGVQDISFRFFEEANAILFVHSIKPIESESFRKFVNSVISNRSKESLFLILTHAGHYSNDEVERLHAEAGRLYKNVIPEKRILVVDSLLKLIHCDLDNGVSIEEIRKSENKKKILSSYREQAEDEKRSLIDVVYESSRFEKMFYAINEFSMKAPNLQLQEILEKIKEGYEEQENHYTEKAERLEKKKRNPQEFEEEINRINEALEKYKLSTRETKEDLKSNYSGRHSTWQQDIDELKVRHPELITGSNSVESARKYTVDALNAVQDKVDNFSRELTQKLGEVLEKTGNTFKEEHQISIPKVDLEALEEKAKRNAYREESTGYWDKEPLWKIWKLFNRDVFVLTGTKKVFDDKKFLGDYKTKCNVEFYKIVNDLPNKSKEVLDLYLDLFSKEVDSVIHERQKALKKEQEEKQTNQEMIAEIKELGRKKKAIRDQKARCIEVLVDIK